MLGKIRNMKKWKIALAAFASIVVVSLGTLGIVKATTPTPENVAPNAWVQVDHPNAVTYHQDFVGVVKNINDGSTSNPYKHGFYKTSVVDEYIYLTLDDTYDISSISVFFSTGDSGKRISKEFDMSVWTGKKWEALGVKTNADTVSGEAKWDLSSEVKKGTAVRLHITKTSDAKVTWLNEFQVMAVKSDKKLMTPQILIKSENYASAAVMQSINASYAADKLVDGTKWSHRNYVAGRSLGENGTDTIDITLKEAGLIDSVIIYPAVLSDYFAGGFPVDFTISVYNGKEWVDVKKVTGENLGAFQTKIANMIAPRYMFDPIDATAVRITVTKLSLAEGSTKDYALRIGEIEVKGVHSEKTGMLKPGEVDPNEKKTNPLTGQNMALNAEVTMNVPEWAKKDFAATEAVDGVVLEHHNFATTTGLKETATEEVVLTLKQASKLHSIALFPAIENGTYLGGFPVDFTVEGYDGSKWVTLTSQTGQSVGGIGAPIDQLEQKNYVFDKVEVSAVRIVVTKHSVIKDASTYALRLGEVQLMGSKSTKTILKPGEVPEEPLKGSNVALNGDVEMKVPDWATSFPATRLVNGSVLVHNDFVTGDTYTKQASTDSFKIVFKEASKVDTVLLYPAVQNGKYIGGYPVDFTISVYDGTKWVEVKKVTNETIGSYGMDMSGFKPKRYEFTAVDATGLMITVTKLSEVDSAGSGKYALRLGEAEVYGEKSDKTDMKKPEITKPSTGGSQGGTSTGTSTAYPNKVTKIDNTKNLALYRPSNASTHLGDYGASTEKVNDGSISSFWASDDRKFVKGENQWVEVNLLNNFAIDRVILGARQLALGFPYDFTIEVFYDGEWQVAHTVKGFVADEKAPYVGYEFKFPAVIGNKVRVVSNNFRKVDKSNSMVITELAVYGSSVSGKYVLPNENMLTVGTKLTTTTSMEDYDYYMVNLTDGNLKSGWSSVPNTENVAQTIEIDARGEIQLSEIQIKPAWGGHGFPKNFVISVYENEKWVDVYEAKDYPKPEDEAIQRFQFETKKCTKFKITVTDLAKEAGMYAVKMNEILAYPNHTGDEFDSNKVESAVSYKKPAAAEVLKPDNELEANKETMKIQKAKMIAGISVITVSILASASVLLLSKKKKVK